MKRLIMLATILTVLAVTVPHASAADTQAATVAATTQTQPVVTQVAAQSQRKGVFARLWELEKRKNAAIRRMFSRG